MAAPVCPSTPTLGSAVQPSLTNPPKTLLFLPAGSVHGGTRRAQLCSASSNSFCSLSSAANYAALKLTAKPSAVERRLPQRRSGVVRMATIEEIEAEKSSIEKDAKARMEKTIETVRTNFNSVRTNRANPAMLDKIEVEYYGTPVSLKSIAQISTPDASSLLVQPYDKSSLKSIEKAIVQSDIGLNPNNDGEVIRMSLPELTSERRKELTKVVAKLAEEGKGGSGAHLRSRVPIFLGANKCLVVAIEVAVRNIRRDVLKAYEKLEKEKKLSEDNVKDLSSDLQKLTDGYMKKIDSIYKQKEKELEKV